MQLPWENRSWKLANPLQHPLIICASVGEALPDRLYLSDEEIARANALVHTEAKKRFLLQHHLLRGFLSHWLGVPPTELGFVKNAYGKPALENAPLHFSISRSGQHLAFYFGPIAGGIDVEEHRPSQPFQAIIESHFHPNEQRVALQNNEGFFRIWTRKEAALKAIGTGLIDELSAFDCSADHLEFSGQTYSLSTNEALTHTISLALAGTGTTPPPCFHL